MKTKLPLLALLAAALIVGCDEKSETAEQAGGQNQAVEAVAYVNGEPISKTMLEFHLERRTQGQPDRASPQDREMLLNELVEMTLLAQEAQKQKLDQDPLVAARIDNLRMAILAQAQVEQLTKEAPDDAAIKAEYDKRFGGEAAKEYHARHILVDSKEKAEQVVAQLNKGTDFAKLAEEHSAGPTGPNGGDLGWFQPEQMVPPFAEAVKKLEPGSYTKEPVQTQFGWHVIKLEETRPVAPPAIEQVREQLINSVTQQRIEQHLEGLRKQAEIRFEKKPEAAPATQAQPEAKPQAEAQPQQEAQPQAEQAAPAEAEQQSK